MGSNRSCPGCCTTRRPQSRLCPWGCAAYLMVPMGEIRGTLSRESSGAPAARCPPNIPQGRQLNNFLIPPALRSLAPHLLRVSAVGLYAKHLMDKTSSWRLLLFPRSLCPPKPALFPRDPMGSSSPNTGSPPAAPGARCSEHTALSAAPDAAATSGTFLTRDRNGPTCAQKHLGSFNISSCICTCHLEQKCIIRAVLICC